MPADRTMAQISPLADASSGLRATVTILNKIARADSRASGGLLYSAAWRCVSQRFHAAVGALARSGAAPLPTKKVDGSTRVTGL